MLDVFVLVERGLEHHELICQVYNMWTPADEGRFYFRKDFSKYELFRNPTVSVNLQSLCSLLCIWWSSYCDSCCTVLLSCIISTADGCISASSCSSVCNLCSWHACISRRLSLNCWILLSYTLRVSQKTCLQTLSMSSPNINRFSKFLDWQTVWKICNKVIIKYPLWGGGGEWLLD